jgi:hypothetical protein
LRRVAAKFYSFAGVAAGAFAGVLAGGVAGAAGLAGAAAGATGRAAGGFVSSMLSKMVNLLIASTVEGSALLAWHMAQNVSMSVPFCVSTRSKAQLRFDACGS